MAAFIESLESRALFSAAVTTLSQDAGDINTSSQAMRTDLASWTQASGAAVRAFFFLTHTGGNGTHSSRPAIRILSADETAGFHKVGHDFRSLATVTIRDIGAIVSDLKKILKASTPALLSKMSADIAKMKGETAALETTASKDIQAVDTLAEKDFAALAALSSLKDQAAKAKTGMISGLHTAMTDLTTLSTRITKFVTDASA